MIDQLILMSTSFSLIKISSSSLTDKKKDSTKKTLPHNELS